MTRHFVEIELIPGTNHKDWIDQLDADLEDLGARRVPPTQCRTAQDGRKAITLKFDAPDDLAMNMIKLAYLGKD